METREKKNRFTWKSLISIVLVLSGILLILVPLIMTYINTKRNDDIIEEFLRQSEQAASSADSMTDEDVEDFYIPEEIVLDETQTNTEAAPSPESANSIEDNTASPAPSENTEPVSSPVPEKKPRMSREEIKKRTIGVLIIPKIDVKILIMDGVDDKTLSVAAGRLPGTGNFDEIGNCVIAGHRSHTFGKYLNRLNELEDGDEITIQTPDKTLKYIAYKTNYIIEPTDFSITNKNDTDKILTLFTCHPPGIGDHRLVVQAKQVE